MSPVLNTTPNRAPTESIADVMDTRRERRPVNRRHPMALRIPAVANPQLALRLVIIQVESVLPNSHFHSSVASASVSGKRKMTNCVSKVPPLSMRMRSLTYGVFITPLDGGPSETKKFPMGPIGQPQRLGRISIVVVVVCIIFCSNGIASPHRTIQRT
jgi:hypothetical protein